MYFILMTLFKPRGAIPTIQSRFPSSGARAPWLCGGAAALGEQRLGIVGGATARGWIGGKGKRAVRRTVELGDGYLAISVNAQTLATETVNLRQIAQQEARDPDSIPLAEIGRIVMQPNASMASKKSGVDGLWIWVDMG